MRILLVEDNQKLGRSLKKGLEAEKYVVDTASDGEEGEYFAYINEYDLIILDIRLPKKDGYTLCREIRNKGNDTPVLMLTANDMVSQKIEGLDSGADDYLTKPFDFGELLARLRALLRRKYSRTEPDLIVGNLCLNPATHEVTRGGKRINLTSTEHRILKYFMESESKILTREMIAEHSWDMNFDPGSNIIDVYINYLRKKIDKGFKKKLIHTVRGTGYVMKPGYTE